MLEAYEHAADAFTTTAAERQAEPESWWVKRIGSPSGTATAFGAWDGDKLVGTVAIEYSSKPKTRHSALVLGMYVTPSHIIQPDVITNKPANVSWPRNRKIREIM